MTVPRSALAIVPDASPATAGALITRPIMLRGKQAALLTGLSEDYLRRSDCPRVELRGTGARDKRRVIGYLYDDLLDWLKRHRR